MNAEKIKACLVCGMRVPAFRHILVHGESVKRNAACSHIIRSELSPAGMSVDVAVNDISLALEILEFVIVRSVLTNRSDIAAESKDNLIDIPDDIMVDRHPALVVALKGFRGMRGSVPVSVSVAFGRPPPFLLWPPASGSHPS